jgi:hypothetical protein
VRAVHLGEQVVECAHAVAALEEGVGEVRADEAGATGDQDVFAHSRTRSTGIRARDESAEARAASGSDVAGHECVRAAREPRAGEDCRW